MGADFRMQEFRVEGFQVFRAFRVEGTVLSETQCADVPALQDPLHVFLFLGTLRSLI